MRGLRSVEFKEQVEAIVPGTRNHVLDAWAEIDGKRVSEVAVGQAFDIRVSFEAENVGAHTWHLAVTAKGGGIANFFDQSIGIGNPAAVNDYVQTTWKLYKKGSNIMPAGTGALTLAIKIWMNDDVNVSPSAPPESNW
jgi:hypothetical protein